jgi:hypothetical protein
VLLSDARGRDLERKKPPDVWLSIRRHTLAVPLPFRGTNKWRSRIAHVQTLCGRPIPQEDEPAALHFSLVIV